MERKGEGQDGSRGVYEANEQVMVWRQVAQIASDHVMAHDLAAQEAGHCFVEAQARSLHDAAAHHAAVYQAAVKARTTHHAVTQHATVQLMAAQQAVTQAYRLRQVEA